MEIIKWSTKFAKLEKMNIRYYPIFLYEAIFAPEGMKKPSKSIIRQPELQVYIADFGKEDDWCLVVEIKEKIVSVPLSLELSIINSPL